MKKLMVAVVGACASFVSFAYDWTGKTGVVTLTETAEVTDADLEVVTNLTGIVLQGAETDLIFNNATVAATMRGTITGDGRIVKRGAADVFLGTPHDSSIAAVKGGCADYYTTGGIKLETGHFWCPQDGGSACTYGPVEMVAGTTLHLPNDKSTTLDALNGDGTVSNGRAWVWRKNADEAMSLNFGAYGDTAKSDFAGTFEGNFNFNIRAYVTLTGESSLCAGSVSSYRNDYNSLENHGILRIAKFGMRPPTSLANKTSGDPAFEPYASTAGTGSAYYYGNDFEVNYSGQIHYIGSGETTDKLFRFGSVYNMACDVLDAGAIGGVTFTGNWNQYNTSKTDGVILRGSNTTEMVLENAISSSDGILSFLKRGTGTWRLAHVKDRSGYKSPWFLEEGTLRFDSIADTGVDCSLGLSTVLYRFTTNNDLPAFFENEANKIPYAVLVGGDKSVPTFEYTGSNHLSRTTDRLIGLKGQGGRIRSNVEGGVIELLGGVEPSDATLQTLYLDGTSVRNAKIGNLSDGSARGKLAVVKEGAGEWKLARDLTFTGPLTVKEGTLTISPEGEPRPYRWYRLVITKLGKLHGAEDMTDCTPSDYYIRLRGIALYEADGTQYTPTMTDIYPENASSDAGSAAGIYAADFWQRLRPGEVTIGEYHGSRYCTYLNGMPSNLFANMTKTSHTVYNTYLGCTPGPNSSNAWVPIVFRLPEDAPEIAYYDVLADHNSETYNHVATFKLEASVDGIIWNELHNTPECVHSLPGKWASSRTTEFTLGANCLDENRGFAIASKPAEAEEPVSYATNLNTPESISVFSGATLAAEGEVILPRLTVDCAGEGVATVKGFKIAETGVLTLANAPKGEVKLPVAFIDCEDLENLENWTAVVAGSARNRCTITVSGGEVTLKPFGMAILIR